MHPRWYQQEKLQYQPEEGEKQHENGIPPVVWPQSNVKGQTAGQKQCYGSVRGLPKITVVYCLFFQVSFKYFHVCLYPQKCCVMRTVQPWMSDDRLRRNETW